MNINMFLGGAIALSFTFAVGSASAIKYERISMPKKNQSRRLTRQHKRSRGVVGDIPMKHSIPVLPVLRRSAVALLVPALALCALALPARADTHLSLALR